MPARWTMSSLLVSLPLLLGLCGAARGGADGPPAPAARADRYGDPLPAGALARAGTVRLRHPGWVTTVAFSPDARLIAALATDGTLRLWDRATGTEVRRLAGPPEKEDDPCLAFSPDG